jgi:surface antigen
MPTIRTLAAALSFALCAGGAAAQNMGFLKDAPISFMDKQDMAMMERNYVEALDALADGQTSTWTNPKTGHSGTATPIRTTKENGRTCRLLEITNQAGGQSGRTEWTFCKTKDGWKTSAR